MNKLGTWSAGTGLYIHIPFCAKKCDYCDFYSCTRATEFIPRYARALSVHIAETAALVKGQVNTIYFGGGTPALLGANELSALMKQIKREFVLKNPEVTLELNPESTDVKLLKKLIKAGFNRLSIGVQSAIDTELALLGRLHNFAGAVRAYRAARETGFSNISIDLMYGIESQSLASFERTLDEIIALAPEHISCYGLKVEEGTPLWDRRHETDLPSDDLQAEMYILACKKLLDAGYSHYEISNWSKAGFESRHNLKYWRLEPYLGFGPSAHSDYGGRRYSNISDLEEYIEGIEQGDAVISDIEEITLGGRAYEYLMLGLRTSEGVESKEYTDMFYAPFDGVEEKLLRYEKEGLAKFDGRWSLTDRGYLLSNSIIGSLL